jgi:hypothetical protein
MSAKALLTKMTGGRIAKPWAVCLTVLAVYTPFCWLLFMQEWNWDSVFLWTHYPGLAISALIPPSLSFGWLPRGPDGALIFTALLLGISIFITLRFRRAFWPLMAGLFALSSAFSWVIYQLMKA